MTLDHDDLLHLAWAPAAHDDARSELTREVADLVGPFALGAFRALEPWPFPPGPRGALRLPDGAPAHGAFVQPDGDHVELVVANNGWPIEHRRCPGLPPPEAPITSAVNYWVSQQPSLAVVDGCRVGSIDPNVAALVRVAEGRKPLGLADTDDEATAELWAAACRLEGIEVVVTDTVFDCCGGERVWFLAAARRERFADLLDLDVLRRWYADALRIAGADGLREPVDEALRELDARSPADYLTRVDDLVTAPYGFLGAAVAGVVLGYWPPTSAALEVTAFAPAGATTYEPGRFPVWDELRACVTDLGREHGPAT